MNCNGEHEMWDWEGQGCDLEDNTSIDITKCLGNEDHLPNMFCDATTPVKACGDLAYQVTNDETMEKDVDQYREPSSQAKRRRMLHFEPEVVAAPIFHDDMFLRSQETQDSLEDAVSEMSQWVAGFSEGTCASSSDYLDPSSESWIADCLNDAEMHLGTENICASGASGMQIDITELCNTPPEHDATVVENQPIQTPQNIVFKGRKSYICTPPKLASAVVYPFTFIKPCGLLGDMTLKDINQRIHAPPNSKQNEEQDHCGMYPTSAFSGKPVVGKTKIRTEGGEGSITILRTKG